MQSTNFFQITFRVTLPKVDNRLGHLFEISYPVMMMMIIVATRVDDQFEKCSTGQISLTTTESLSIGCFPTHLTGRKTEAG